MRYDLHQRGRAAIDFLADLRTHSDRFEERTDERAANGTINIELLPNDVVELSEVLTPVLERDPEFRILRLCRDWTLEEHGDIAMRAFEEMRSEIEPELNKLNAGPAELAIDESLQAPEYWQDFEFHKSEGGWDGHDYMGFVHGELIHRRMVNPTFAGIIYAVRKSVAEKAAEFVQPEKVLEVGCCSGQYTQGLAEVFPAAELWACDLSVRQLEQAQRYANELGLHWHLFQAAGENLGVDGGQFDLVTSYAVFHELPAEAQLAHLREYLRVLKPGGYAVVGDVKAYRAYSNYDRWKNDYWNYIHGGDPYWRSYANGNLADMALEGGFAEASWEGLGEHQYPFVLIARKGGGA